MPKRPLLTTALSACVTLTGGCASGLRSPASPWVELPPLAVTPCQLPVLAADGPITWADLEAAYMARGEALVACDQARRVAVAAVTARVVGR